MAGPLAPTYPAPLFLILEAGRKQPLQIFAKNPSLMCLKGPFIWVSLRCAQ